MNKSELESKHVSELHELAAEAGVERYRMLSRGELIEKLPDGGGKPQSKPKGDRSGGRPERGRQRGRGRDRERKPREPKPEPKAVEPKAEQAEQPKPQQPAPEQPKPKRKRRRRRWGRRRKKGGIREHADRWLEAWNQHDLDEIVACYSEQVEFVLPALVGDDEVRKIDGREALREHFRHGLELAPNLAVSEESLLTGPSGFAILYRREDGHRAIEAVELDGDGLAARVRVYYEREQS